MYIIHLYLKFNPTKITAGCPKKMVANYSKLEWIGLNYIVKPLICFKLEQSCHHFFWDTLYMVNNKVDVDKSK